MLVEENQIFHTPCI